MSFPVQGALLNQRTPEVINVHGAPAQMNCAAAWDKEYGRGYTSLSVRNNEGGYVYRLDDMKRLERIVIFGFDGVRYYQDSVDENLFEKTFNCIQRIIIDGKGPEAVRLILRISEDRRNLKQNSLLFAYAMLARCDDEATKEIAYEQLRKICRIPTQLFLFIEYCESASSLRGDLGKGWGRAHRKAVCSWYTSFEHHPHKLARLVSKYKQAKGTSHVDVLRRAHPKVDSTCIPIAFILKYIIKNLREARRHYKNDLDTDVNLRNLSEQLEVYDKAKTSRNCDELCSLIREYKLSREHCATDMLQNKNVWSALLPHMNVEALIRNLGTMSELGLFAIGSEEEQIAVNKVQSINSHGNVPIEEIGEEIDQELSWRQGTQLMHVLHPFQIMKGWLTYKKGRGEKSNKEWQVNERIVQALEKAYYQAFQTVEPTGKKLFCAVHMSGQMTQPALSPAHRTNPFDLTHAAATMMMVTYRTEENVIIKGFSDTLVDIDIQPEDTLQQVIDKSFAMPYGGTNCALPMVHAIEEKIKDIDAFLIYTDNETVNGNVHAAEALRQYRQYSENMDVKLIVCSMAANDFSIADQDDPYMLDIIGFDSAAPRLISEFIRFVR